MRTDIINFLKQEVERRCRAESNFFGMGCFHHIRAVAENASFLAREYGADEEVAVIAAWLHDIASVTDYELYEEHHIHGMQMAGELLEQWNYDTDRLELVRRCIFSHRGSKAVDRLSVEEICVADADAISHFDAIPSLFHLAYVNRGMGLEEGTEFVRNKLERSFAKLSDRSRVIYREKYESSMRLLGGKI